MNWDAILLGAIAATPPSLVAFFAWRTARTTVKKLDEVHIIINERLTQLLASTAAASRAEGVAEEKERR